MLPHRVSNPGPLTFESGALPIALRGPATAMEGLLKKLGLKRYLLSSESSRFKTYIIHLTIPCRIYLLMCHCSPI